MAVFYQKVTEDGSGIWERCSGGMSEEQGTSGKISGDFSRLREILGDNHNMGKVRVRITSEEKDDPQLLALVFPVYLYDFIEDTFARVLHHSIEGCGYAYRECVGRRILRLREYDGLFRKVASEDPDTAAETAIGRLLYDHDLAPGHRENYSFFLEEFGIGTVRKFLERDFFLDRYTAFDYLFENCLVRKETADEAISLFGDSHAEIVARLLRYKRKHWPGRHRNILSLEGL